ncbi:MAG: hypothetical protein ACRD1K_03930 [Acidimicrobiales bacterium]
MAPLPWVMRRGPPLRLDGEARIVEAWGFVADQAGLDALFDSEPADHPVKGVVARGRPD